MKAKHILFLLPVALMLACGEANTDNGSEPAAEPTADTLPANDNTDEANSATLDESSTEPTEDTAAMAFTEPEAHVDLAAEEIEFDDSWMYADAEFMIILSSTSFDKAVERAQEASEKLGTELRIDGLHETEGHLSWPEQECEDNGFGYPCYVARGRYDEGNYVTIEQSDAYNGFTRGYYIVIVSSGAKGDAERRNYLTQVQQHYDDAYIKSAPVYMGCMH